MARSSPTYKQKCAYCGDKFVPTKRGTQRFCGASCRVSYCRKKKAGTLGQLTRRAGPPRPAAGLSFGQSVLAAGLGSLGANGLTQAGEYLLVTRALAQQLQALQHAVAAWGPPPPAAPTPPAAAPLKATRGSQPGPVVTPAERARPARPLSAPAPDYTAAFAAMELVLQEPWPAPPAAEPAADGRLFPAPAPAEGM